jgi:hypothetical protein
MKTNQYLATFLVLCSNLMGADTLMSQVSSPFPIGSEVEYLMRRENNLQMNENTGFSHSSIRPIEYDNIKPLIDTIWEDSKEREYVVLHTKQLEVFSKKPVLKHFYKTPGNLFEVNTTDFNLTINPLLNVQMGYQKNSDGRNGLIFNNQRGLELKGDIDDKVYFMTNIYESQTKFNTYEEDWINKNKAIPGAGYYKIYDSRFTSGVNDGYDYLLATGHVGVKVSKHINVELGHGKNFIGEGYRSLLLSDFSNNYLYLKTNVRIWKFQYQSIFAELTGLYGGPNAGDRLLPKKYMAAHYLSFDLSKRLNIGLFETAILNRTGFFELQYLNPVIFYRTIEQSIGSPDNVILGSNLTYRPHSKVKLYAQFVLDEFKLGQLTSGWWANKYGIQLGANYYNAFGVKNLDLQAEFNSVRPYTYSHNDSLGNYTHFNQPLAHPMGANFHEVIGIVNYRPHYRWWLTGQLQYALVGYDTPLDNANWGQNIIRPNNPHPQDLNNTVAQGNKSNLLIGNLYVGYMLFHNLRLEANLLYRSLSQQQQTTNAFNTISFNFGVRWNVQRKLNTF